MQKKSKSYRFFYFGLLAVSLVIIGLFVFRPALFFSPLTLNDIMNSRNELTSSVDNLRERFEENKRNYQTCITALVGLYADTDAQGDPAHDQAIADKNLECQELYNTVVQPAATSSDECTQLLDRYSTLSESLTEIISDLKAQEADYYNALETQITSSISDTEIQAIVNELRVAEDFQDDLLAEQEDFLNNFCLMLGSIHDPCTAIGNGQIEDLTPASSDVDLSYSEA